MVERMATVKSRFSFWTFLICCMSGGAWGAERRHKCGLDCIYERPSKPHPSVICRRLRRECYMPEQQLICL